MDEIDIQLRIEELKEELAQEDKQWQLAGINPSMFQTDPYLMNIKLRMCQHIIKEKFDMSDEELDMYFKGALLEQFQMDRKMAEEAKKNAKPDIIVPPLGFKPPPLFGPNGKPFEVGGQG